MLSGRRCFSSVVMHDPTALDRPRRAAMTRTAGPRDPLNYRKANLTRMRQGTALKVAYPLILGAYALLLSLLLTSPPLDVMSSPIPVPGEASAVSRMTLT
jgi:hypothetical protein